MDIILLVELINAKIDYALQSSTEGADGYYPSCVKEHKRIEAAISVLTTNELKNSNEQIALRQEIKELKEIIGQQRSFIGLHQKLGNNI